MVDATAVGSVLQAALMQVGSPVAIVRVFTMLCILVTNGALSIKANQAHWWPFSRAVLSTILVDALFLLAAVLA